jgi:hypothetical protein
VINQLDLEGADAFAALLGCSTRHVRRWMQEQEFPRERLPHTKDAWGRLRGSRVEVMAWAERMGVARWVSA